MMRSDLKSHDLRRWRNARQRLFGRCSTNDQQRSALLTSWQKSVKHNRSTWRSRQSVPWISSNLFEYLNIQVLRLPGFEF